MSAKRITRDELLERMARGEAPALLDVRTAREFERGRVPGAVHVPFWSLPARLRRVPADREEEIAVYCELGPRAWLAGAWLRACGWKRVAYLRGHMYGWRSAGLPTDAGPGD